MPGSRPKEMTRNFPLMLDSFAELKRKRPGLRAVVAATNEQAEARLRDIAERHGGVPEGMGFVHGKTNAVIAWCCCALVVSGTVTLQIARARKPMVIFYKSNPLLYTLLARGVLSTEFFTLPNLVAAREIVREFVPHFDGHAPVTAAVAELLDRADLRKLQIDHLDGVARCFDGSNAAEASADEIERVLGLRPAAS